MPKAPSVPHNILKAVILAAADGVINASGEIPGPTNPIWATINKSLGDKLTPTYIYQYVHENRHESYQELRHHRGILSPPASPLRISDYINSQEDTSDSLPSSNEDNLNEKIKPERKFVIIISSKDWETIKPVERVYNRNDRATKRSYKVLPPLEWTPLIIDLLWEQHKIPCPYSFERATVFSDKYNREAYVKMPAKCKECGASGQGRILEEPTPGDDVQMEWRANDTRRVPHDNKRRLTGKRREAIGGMHLKNASAAVYRRHQAKSLMDQGDVEAPQLFKSTVLRKAKQEQRDKTLKVYHDAHPIMSLSMMKHSEPYAGSIHDIALDKVIVQYFTPAQMLIYKSYWKQGYVVLSLDATGRLVRKLTRVHGLSGHIFLYELVMNTGRLQFPVCQMLSEKQDANTILYWLNEWERHGAPCPREIVVDNSSALKSAVVRSFGRSADLQTYLERCFMFLTEKCDTLPPCYLRLDVAHFLNAAIKWKLWQDRERKRLRDFYLRCLGILIKATSLNEFQDVLSHVLTMALSPNDGQCQDSPLPVEESLQFLAEKIKGEQVVVEESTNDPEEKNGMDLPDCDDSVEEMKMGCTKIISQWLNGVLESVQKKIPQEGDGRLNPYYCPSVAEQMTRLAKEFPLWSAVLVKDFQSPNITASSAPVEGDFADIKINILKGTARPLRIDKFVATHLESIEGSCRLAGVPNKKGLISREITSNKISALAGKFCFDNPLEQKDFMNEKDELLSEVPAKNTAITNDEISEQIDPDLIDIVKRKNEKSDIDDTCKDKEIIEEEELSSSESNKTLDIAPYDLNATENWRGLAKRGPRRKSKYLTPAPQFQAAIQANRLKQPSKRLLKNGNITGFVTIEGGSQILIKNSCAFDAICQVMAEMYILYPQCREFMDESDNSFINTARSLAVDGAVKSTLILRADMLSAILEPLGVLQLPQKNTRSSRKSIISLEYNCYGNAPALTRKLLAGECCAEIVRDCQNTECPKPKRKKYDVLETNSKLLLQEGLAKLDKAILASLQLGQTNDGISIVDKCGRKCLNSATLTCSLGPYFVVDVDMLATPGVGKLFNTTIHNRAHELREFPMRLLLCGKFYQLVGLVAHRSDHYVAYTYRPPDLWEVFDDLSKDVVICRDVERVSPHLIVYIAV